MDDYDPNFTRNYADDLRSMLFEPGVGKDTQQSSPPFELDDIMNFDISPPDLTYSPYHSPKHEVQVQVYNEDFVFHVQNGTPTINIDTSMNAPYIQLHGPSSSAATTPITPPGLVSPSQPGYNSSPNLLAGSPATPVRTLCPVPTDVFFSSPAPHSPYSPQQPSPWPLAQSSPEPERPIIPFSEHPRGPMVPQKRYKPHTNSDRKRYVDEVKLEHSITFFMQNPDELGISLRDAMHGRYARLVAREEPMFRERGPSISVRINWPGFQPWSRQIPTRDFRNPPGPITRAKLAKNVAKSVARFIGEHKGRAMEEDGDPAWLVGPGKIDVFDLVLVRLDHVSKGSWQAQLQLAKPRP
ncbi:hypothetical protein F5148DRAFT_1280687 [Russula earlei]|uniref:Uncharacterized protein n=1 Tax=Russula earlei TaxID=71964 RepID=A0ACC0UIS0_9AGAM|nr:hypothetical protein F5148DRAFT_1280687 [Russula earlei]